MAIPHFLVFALDIENKVVKPVLFRQNKEEKKGTGEMIALRPIRFLTPIFCFSPKMQILLLEKV
jgi:hypothetical protein